MAIGIRSGIKSPGLITISTMLVTTLIVMLIYVIPVLTQQNDNCVIKGPLADAKKYIDEKIERNELRFEGENVVNYYDTITVDTLDIAEKFVRNTKNSSLKEALNAAINKREYLVASDLIRSNGGISQRYYYDIAGNNFATSYYDESGSNECYTRYYDCLGHPVGQPIYPLKPCIIYPG